jgi:hypothetical protein
MTERRTKRNVDMVDAVTVDILKIDREKFLVDSLDNKTLRKKLKKVHAEIVQVFKGKHHEFGQDSLIVLSRYNSMLTFGEIVIDFKKKERELSNIDGLKRIGRRTYFRKKTLAIS